MTEPRADAGEYAARYPEERRLHDAEEKLADARERLASLETEVRHRATRAWVLGLAFFTLVNLAGMAVSLIAAFRS